MSISPMNLDSSRALSGGAELQPLRFGTTRSSAEERPQTMDAALDALVKSMTDDSGKVNGDNPLVKMLSDFLEKTLSSMLQQMGAGTGAQGASQGTGASTVQDMSPDELKNALSGMLEQLLGSQAGASDALGGGAGGGADILSQLLGGLAQDKLGSLLTPTEQGDDMTFSDDDKGLMKEVAQFMDQHTDRFGSPDDADGKTRSWSDEVDEDNLLDGAEAGAFQQAIQMIGQSAASGAAPASGTLANSTLPISAGEGGGGAAQGLGSSGGAQGLGSGALGGADVTLTLSAEDFLSLIQGGQGSDASPAGGATAQSQALSQDASQAAGSIMDKLFS